MSFESAAPATDEFSILDLFGPEASPQAQLLVQEAADRSMDEMAEVINAAVARDEAQGIDINALLAEQTKLIPHFTVGYADGPAHSVGHKAVEDAIKNLTSWRGLRNTTYGLVKPSSEMLPFSVEKFQLPKLPMGISEETIPFGGLSQLALDEVLKTWGTIRSLSTRSDIAAKESLLSQLARQLTLAMAEGVDLANASLILNTQNPETKRIESVTIHAGEDDNDQSSGSLEWKMSRAYEPRHE